MNLRRKKPDINKGVNTGKNVYDIVKNVPIPMWLKIGLTIGAALAAMFFGAEAYAQNNVNAKRVSLDTLRARDSALGGTGNFNMPYSYESGVYSTMFVNDTLLHEWVQKNGGGSPVIPINQIVRGSGTGITSSSGFTYNGTNAIGNTGSFQWDNVNIDNTSVKTTIASNLNLGRGSTDYVSISATTFFPLIGTYDLGANNNPFNSLFIGNSSSTSELTGVFTADRTATFQDSDGTVAWLTDIPSIAQPADQIVRGSGTGITSSAGFTYDGTNAIGNTGSFTWDNVNINSNQIQNTSGGLLIENIGISGTNIEGQTTFVGIDDDLLPIGTSRRLGLTTNPWLSVAVGGSSGNTSTISGTFTTNRSVTLPDLSGTVFLGTHSKPASNVVLDQNEYLSLNINGTTYKVALIDELVANTPTNGVGNAPISYNYIFDTSAGGGAVGDVMTLKYYDQTNTLQTLTRTGNQTDVDANITVAYGSTISMRFVNTTFTDGNLYWQGNLVATVTGAGTIDYNTPPIYALSVSPNGVRFVGN